MSDNKDKRVYVVLGMARTGTSAISRFLKVFDVDLGNALVGSNQSWNPTGFWEDKEIVYGINGRIFSRLKFAPYGLLTIDPGLQTAEQMGSIFNDAKQFIANKLKAHTSFGFKDPSTVKVVPFWRNVFASLAVEDNYIITLRHPLAAARSYQMLTGCDLELGLLLWCAHLIQAVNSTHGAKRLVISYDILLKNCHSQIPRMLKTFNLSSWNEGELNYYINHFLDEKMVKFSVDHDHLQSQLSSRAATNCYELYSCLLALAKDEMQFDTPEFNSCWQAIMDEYNKLQPFYLYLDRILKVRNQLKRRKRDINKSIIWKLSWPLRYLEDSLRQWRRTLQDTRK